MNDSPADLGKSLLIAMDDTPGSLAMLGAAVHQLPDLAHTKVTLMHYLAPVYWEYGGGSPETAHYLDEQAREREEDEEALTLEYFDQAKAILQDAGVAPDQIVTKEDWSADDVTDAVLQELRSGTYTGVVVGREHHDALARVLHLDLAHALRRHTDNVAVWVVDTTEA
jgi:hypothetical protein